MSFLYIKFLSKHCNRQKVIKYSHVFETKFSRNLSWNLEININKIPAIHNYELKKIGNYLKLVYNCLKT